MTSQVAPEMVAVGIPGTSEIDIITEKEVRLSIPVDGILRFELPATFSLNVHLMRNHLLLSRL